MPQAFEPEDRDEADTGRFTRRMVLLGLTQLAGLAALTGRLYQLQVVDHARYRRLATSNRVAAHVILPARGRILDRSGNVLAEGEEAFRATLVPSFAPDVAEVLSTFGRIVPLPDGELQRLVARARRQRPNEPIVLASDLTFEQVAEINLLAPQLPGVETEYAPRRRYPYGKVAGHIVGHTGNVERVAIDDDPMLHLPWMRVGRTGLELGADKALRGRSGTRRVEVDARGRVVRAIGRTDAQPGRDVVSTLDVELQAKVLERLAGERRASVVVIDVASGGVLAMASVPGYDPQRITDGISHDTWARMQAAAGDPLVNRAISGQYPPGSTFKMVTALAALEAGRIGPREKIHCAGSYTLADKTYRCWNRGGHGPQSLLGALRVSCDVCFYELAGRVGIDEIARMARRLGLGQVYDCGLDLQKPGLVPTRDWKIGRFGRRWLGGETILAGIGQGYVLATPLQLAVMTARIASGMDVSPTLVHSADEGRTPPARSLGLSPAHLALVRRGMIDCVNADGGTGWQAGLGDGAAVVAGKTGTSQVSRASGMRNSDELAWVQRDHALFVGYAPADAPRYAVSVVVEHGGAGGSIAAPIARDVLSVVLARDPAAKPPVRAAEQPAASRGGAG